MLLTSSQISMGLSSAIGYILQQQTVHELQAILRPVQTVLPQPVQDVSVDAFDWKTVAYVQIVSRHEDVCAAAVTFAELARRGSRADRVLLYPRAWEREERSVGDEERRSRERNVRLLRKVVARYGIVMKAVEMERQDAVGNRVADATISVQKLFSLTEWQTLAYLAPPGVVYNTSALDEVFSLDTTSPQLDFWTNEATGQEGQNAEKQLVASLIRPNPSTEQHMEMLRRPGMDMMTISKLLGPDSRSDKHLFGGTGSLRNLLTDDKNVDEFWAAYMRFSDPNIPGPEYDIPQELWDSSRPTSRQDRLVWEKVYADYRKQRMAVCGLEIEPTPQNMLDTRPSSRTLDKESKIS